LTVCFIGTGVSHIDRQMTFKTSRELWFDSCLLRCMVMCFISSLCAQIVNDFSFFKFQEIVLVIPVIPVNVKFAKIVQ